MTSRQRVLAALNHQQPDRAPIDLGMHTSTGISAFAYEKLRKFLGVSEKDRVRIRDYVQCTAIVEEEVLERFHCDCKVLCPVPEKTYVWKPRGNYEFTVPSCFQPRLNEKKEWVVEHNGSSMRMPDGGFFFDGDWITIEDRWSDEALRAYADEAERIKKDTEYFTALVGLSALYGSTLDYFCKMYTDPDEIKEECEQGLEHMLKICERIFNIFGDNIQMVCMGGDLGTQTAPFCNPELFGELVAPSLKKLCGFIHENSDYKIFLHSCGAIEPFIKTFIDCGIDALNPVQVSAAGMDPEQLKKKYGGRMTFWGGGVDTQNVLGNKSAAEVRGNVRELIGKFKTGGGYVFCPVHNIMGDVPPENINAAYEEAYRAGVGD